VTGNKKEKPENKVDIKYVLEMNFVKSGKRFKNSLSSYLIL
jgi:hypothetical protein